MLIEGTAEERFAERVGQALPSLRHWRRGRRARENDCMHRAAKRIEAACVVKVDAENGYWRPR